MSPGFFNRIQETIKTAGAAPRLPISFILTVLPFALGVWLVATVVLSHLPHLSRDYSVPVRAQVVESRLEGPNSLFSFGTESVFIYRYLYQGQLFKASGYRPGGYLDEAIRAHPPGSMLTAYLDPDLPQFSMVWPGMGSRQGWMLILGLLMLSLSARQIHIDLIRLFPKKFK